MNQLEILQDEKDRRALDQQTGGHLKNQINFKNVKPSLMSVFGPVVVLN